MFEGAATLIAVGSGWLLSELSHWFRGRGRRREAVGKALSDLLEIRYFLHATDSVINQLTSRHPMTEAERRTALDFMGGFLPPSAELPQRYNQAVTDVAGFDPLLGFQLRSRDAIPAWLAKMRAVAVAYDRAGERIPAIDSLLQRTAVEAMDDLLVRVARAHSWRMWWAVRQHLKRRPELPKEVTALMDGLQAPTVHDTADSPVTGDPM